jgi:hypothetical protein
MLNPPLLVQCAYLAHRNYVFKTCGLAEDEACDTEGAIMPNSLQAPPIDIPRHVWDAVNNAIHTSKIDGSVQPISLCYVAVRAALAAYVSGGVTHDATPMEDLSHGRFYAMCHTPGCYWSTGSDGLTRTEAQKAADAHIKEVA